MAEASVTGQVHLIEPTKTFGQKGFRKRTVVLEQTNGRFTNFIPLEFIGDACDSVDELKIGDKIRATYRLTGRKWQKDEFSEVKFFLSAEATSFQITGGSTESPSDGEEDSEIGDDDQSAPF
jgi:hypothetical protein